MSGYDTLLIYKYFKRSVHAEVTAVNADTDTYTDITIIIIIIVITCHHHHHYHKQP